METNVTLSLLRFIHGKPESATRKFPTPRSPLTLIGRRLGYEVGTPKREDGAPRDSPKRAFQVEGFLKGSRGVHSTLLGDFQQARVHSSDYSVTVLIYLEIVSLRVPRGTNTGIHKDSQKRILQ